MLVQFRVDSPVIPLDPHGVARHTLTGEITPASRVTFPNDTTRTWEPFERVINREIVTATQQALLHAVHKLYAPPASPRDPNAQRHASDAGADTYFGLDELGQRVSELCGWNWTRFRNFEGRLRFLDAWLTELRGFDLSAMQKYEVFLEHTRRWDQRTIRKRDETHGETPRKPVPLQRHPQLRLGLHDPHLTLIAYNNHAVLTLRHDENTGKHAAAIARLARLAVWHLLPGACFNLLNLMNVSWKAAHAGFGMVRLRRLDSGVAKAFNELVERRYERMPAAERAKHGFSAAAKKWKRALGANVLSERHPFGDVRGNDQRRKAFVVALAETACKISRPGVNVTSELQLWPYTRLPMLQGTPGSKNDGAWAEDQHLAYGEAVALFYPRDIAEILPPAEAPTSSGDDRFSQGTSTA